MAFICTISEGDWIKSLTLGIYGNRYLKEKDQEPHRDTQQLSIIRDLVSLNPADLIFFHIRGRQTIHGVYEARSSSFWDDSQVWADPKEKFPYRFLFKPSERFFYLCDYDAHIDVHSLYELIDGGQIKSLVTLEFEQNIEGRSVRKILDEDADEIIRLLHRDFRLKASSQKVIFRLVDIPHSTIPLKNKLYKVGNDENAIKAILLYELVHKNHVLRELLDLPEGYDFVNEFFIAPTTRKAIDVLVRSQDLNAIIEVKTNQCDVKALRQALYYRDLFRQRKWMKDGRILVVLVAQSFAKDLYTLVKGLISMNESIELISYSPTDDRKWAKFE